MDHEEVEGGTDSALPVREAKPVVSQAETLDETTSSACGCIPGGVLRPFTSMRGGSNIDKPQRDVKDATGDQPTQKEHAEAQIRACFLTIADIIGLTGTQSIAANFLTLDPVLATPPKTPHLNKNLKNHG